MKACGLCTLHGLQCICYYMHCIRSPQEINGWSLSGFDWMETNEIIDFDMCHAFCKRDSTWTLVPILFFFSSCFIQLVSGFVLLIPLSETNASTNNVTVTTNKLPKRFEHWTEYDQQDYDSRLYVHRNEMETNKKNFFFITVWVMCHESPAIWLLHLLA